MLDKIVSVAAWLNERAGQAAAWCTGLLVLLFCVDVVLRYLAGFSSAAVFELEWHLFALIFLLGAGYTFHHQKHVRVDIFYNRFSPAIRRIIDSLGTLLLLLPLCMVMIWYGSIYAWASWQAGEGSADPGGLPARYLIKAMIPLGFVLLLLQGIAFLITTWRDTSKKGGANIDG